MPPIQPVILVVEDSPDDQELLTFAFEEAGETVQVVYQDTGEAALQWLERNTPQLILLDLNLPAMGGLELLARLKNNATTRRLPVVVMTTSDDEDDLVRAYDAHANAFVRKPLDIQDLVNVTSSTCHFWLRTAVLP